MNLSILIVAAHPDDEVLGCGGAIAKFVSQGASVHVLLLADGVTSRGESACHGSEEINARILAAKLANKLLGSASLSLLSYPDNRMDSVCLLDIVKQIENAIETHRPSIVFTHHAGDVNVDHRLVHDAVVAACRPQPGHCVKELLFFEVPSSTEWRPPTSAPMFNPNYFIDIGSYLDIKIGALNAYQEELRIHPHPRSIKAVESLALWRGATVGVDAAEAFVLGRKIS